MGTEHLDPNADDGTNEWTPNGCTDHHDCVDDGTRQPSTAIDGFYLNTTGSNNDEEFGWSDPTAGGVSVTAVKVWIYGRCGDADDYVRVLPSGVVDWSPASVNAGAPNTTNSWQSAEWTGLSLPIENFSSLVVQFRSRANGKSGASWVIETCYVELTHEVSGTTYDSYITESVTATDTWKQEALHVYDSFLSESVTATDTWKQEFVPVGGATFNSFLTETVTATDTWKQTFNDIVGKTWTNGNATGIWNDADNWLPVGVPANNHDVDFTSGYTDSCSIDVTTANLRSFLMDTGYTGTVSLNANTLHVDYAMDVSSFAAKQGTFNAGTGGIIVSGTWDMYTDRVDSVFTKGTSTVTLTGTGNLAHYTHGQTGNFHNLILAASGKTTTATRNIGTGGVLTIGAGTYTRSSNWQGHFLWGTETNPMVLSGGTVDNHIKYETSAATNVVSTTYQRGVEFQSKANPGNVYTLQGPITAQDGVGAGLEYSIKMSHYVSGRYCELDTAGYDITAETTLLVGEDSQQGGIGILDCGDSTIIVGGDVVIDTTASYIELDTSIWTVSGDWTNTSTDAGWDEGTSIIEFDGDSAQTIACNTKNLYDVKLSGTGEKNVTESWGTNDLQALNDVQVNFSTGNNYGVVDGGELYADPTYTLTLRSASSPTQWNINPLGTCIATRVDVQDSNNQSTPWINAMRPGDIDSGNNDRWEFGKRYLSETVTVADDWIYEFITSGETFARFLSESVTATDTWKEEVWRSFAQYLSESVTATDSWIHEHIEYVVTRYISETVSVSDTWKEEALYVFLRAITESVTATDTWKEETLRLFEQYITETVSVSDDWYHQLIEYVAARFLSESVTVSDSFKQETFHLFERYITEDVSVSDEWFQEQIEYVASSFITEAVTVTDTWKQEVFQTFLASIAESVTVSDTWKQEVLTTIARTLSESVTVTDTWKQEKIEVTTFNRFLSESVTVSDVVQETYVAAIYASNVARIIAIIGGD